MDPLRPPRQAVQRKPLPRLPQEDSYEGQAVGQASMQSQQPHGQAMGLPAPPLRVDTAYNVDQKFADMRISDRAAISPPSYHGGPSRSSPARQGTGFSTATTATTSTSSTAYSSQAPSRVTTFNTNITTPTTSGASTPVRPSRQPTLVGQDVPGPQHNASQNPSQNSASPRPSSKDGEGKEPSFWKTAFDETRFFAGGLIHKPFESTKHYTIVRHSPGLIMYRGPSTCVAVTLLSTPDHPVPAADRTVWMQQRGYSGDTGLKLKSLVGARGSWLDVTPSQRVAPQNVPAADERGYERDIAKILKKAKHEKSLSKRVPRETLVVRIPNASVDGYFRLVVCSGGTPTQAPNGETVTTKRKVLCGSPVFRVASTSTDASIFRGASLRTLPLEAGVKIASMVGTNTVTTIAEPVVGQVQAVVQKYQPGTAATMAATEAYDTSGAASRVDAAGEKYAASREVAYQAFDPSGGLGDTAQDDDAPPEVIGSDAGPEKPFPVSFQGRIVPGTGRSTAQLGVPTANLADVTDDVRLRMKGTYFGWATILPKKGQAEDSRLNTDWIEAIVTVGPSPWAKPAKVVERNEVAVHLLYDFASSSSPGSIPTFFDAKLKVILMGYLRASLSVADGPHPEHDAPLVVTSLSRPRWGPQATMQRMQTERSARSIQDRYVDARGNVQKKVDKIPLHWAGVRTTGAEMRDQLYGNGGYSIPR